VDDAFTYGQIAAANALSDVYAMGGRPLTALAIAAFPKDLDQSVIGRIFAGGLETLQRAGVALLGGHTVQDQEIKFGYAVTGEIHPRRIWTNAGARPGDELFLTKPLGTGIIATALKADRAPAAAVSAAVQAMSRLNRAASEALQTLPDGAVHACTDITGFGLLGHASEVAIKSGVRIELDSLAMPWLDGAERYAIEGRLPGGMHRNRDYYGNLPECGVSFDDHVPETVRELLYDPETAGGLLLAVPDERAEALAAAFNGAGHGLWRIGNVAAGRGIHVR
jgi:selenide,water dikinase